VSGLKNGARRPFLEERSVILRQRWRNLQADVYVSFHRNLITDFYEQTIVPVFAEWQRQRAKYEADDSALADFLLVDLDALEIESARALCLSLQSLWERQLRQYLAKCEVELKIKNPISTSTKWKQVRAAFEKYRHIELQQFSSFALLEELHLVGNVFRHGPGSSLKQLKEDHPHLWSADRGDLEHLTFQSKHSLETYELPVVSLSQLHRYTLAVVDFWNDCQYIYNQSLETKTPILQVELARELEQREKMEARAFPAQQAP
jgi:hypothetical protein